MPLRARHHHQEFLSTALSDEVFEALRHAPDLTMTCCTQRAVPKRSARGLPFFAHARRHDCATAPESEFHLHAKVMIAQAVAAAGWHADLEVPGLTPDAEGWRADVLATRGRARIAFEIQRSSQTIQQIRERQLKYARSGIRGLWLLRGHAATLRSPQLWLHRTPMFTLDTAFYLPRFNLPLDQFIPRVLAGHLRYFPQANQSADVILLTQVIEGYEQEDAHLEAIVLRPTGQAAPTCIFGDCPPMLQPWLDHLIATPDHPSPTLRLLAREPHRPALGGRRLNSIVPLVIDRLTPGRPAELHTVLLSTMIRAVQLCEIPLPTPLSLQGQWWLSEDSL